ncbi:SPOR domain-containing protein [Vibrio algarum]|uniref:SPOR domain-containing protein n=1 Tax=Vibrio algarum TaxID=3020714 RepID=A0ABT4YLW8_9VIBR|nr:SPOR domain-containing protein [Vibrio sp. KJ40-1]MDB1122542.1 SPOR domain-containing protein [Vibrio sp. KJ40-1]
MSKILARKLMVMACCISLAIPSLVSAADDEYICEAKQNSKNELPVLSQDCPVGSGVWGVAPAIDDGLFWIQCGLFNEPHTVKQAQVIYNAVTTDVWVKPEKKGYRCLVGPYEKYSVAQKDLVNLKKVSAYKESFIRNASAPIKSPSNTSAVTKPATKQVPKKAAPKPKSSPAAAVLAPVVDNPAQPKPTVKEAQTTAEKSTKPSETVVARRDAKIGDKYYAIPFLMDGYDQFYMEYGIAWNRLNYERAMQVCESQQMHLPTADDWKLLIDSQVMSKKQWPLHLPYWGDDKQGLFTSGKVTQLTGTSLLNVVCVK